MLCGLKRQATIGRFTNLNEHLYHHVNDSSTLKQNEKYHSRLVTYFDNYNIQNTKSRRRELIDQGTLELLKFIIGCNVALTCLKDKNFINILNMAFYQK